MFCLFGYFNISVTEVFHFLSDLIRTGPEQNPARTELITFRKNPSRNKPGHGRTWPLQNLARAEPSHSKKQPDQSKQDQCQNRQEASQSSTWSEQNLARAKTQPDQNLAIAETVRVEQSRQEMCRPDRQKVFGCSG